LAPGAACVDRKLRAVLHVNGEDSRRVWGTDLDAGRDVRIAPRAGLNWRIDPSAPTRLVDESGALMTFDGEITTRACFDAATMTFLIGRGDVPDPNRPGG
jgi:hypothetical protein